MSYFQKTPPFPWDEDPTSKNKTYRIVQPGEISNSEVELGKLLLRFANSNLQDLFFLKDIPEADKKLVISMSRDMRLLVRHFGDCLCVWKNIKPKELYTLLTKHGKNEKYTLIKPAIISSKPDSAQNEYDQYDSKESRLKNLFDFEEQTPQSLRQIKSNFNQITPCKIIEENKREENFTLFDQHENDKCLRTKNLFDFENVTADSLEKINSDLNQITQNKIGKEIKREELNFTSFDHSENANFRRSNNSEKKNQSWHSGMNKRSYAEGPGTSRAQSPISSQHSHTSEMIFQPSYSSKTDELYYRRPEIPDRSLFQRRPDVSREANIYHTNKRVPNYGKNYKQQEEHCNQTRYYAKQSRWSEDDKHFYDQRF